MYIKEQKNSWRTLWSVVIGMLFLSLKNTKWFCKLILLNLPFRSTLVTIVRVCVVLCLNFVFNHCHKLTDHRQTIRDSIGNYIVRVFNLIFFATHEVITEKSPWKLFFTSFISVSKLQMQINHSFPAFVQFKLSLSTYELNLNFLTHFFKLFYGWHLWTTNLSFIC